MIKNNLMVVAHCDDEMFFGGQELLTEPYNFSCCPTRIEISNGRFFNLSAKLWFSRNSLFPYRDSRGRGVRYLGVLPGNRSVAVL